MLTGDQRLVAEAIAQEAKVDEVHAELLPEDKLNVIRELKKEGTVMMIGDGVNDAPALAIADIGVAMGAAGTDVAMETADIVLMGDRLENIAILVAHARRAKRVLTQNLVFASAVIVVLDHLRPRLLAGAAVRRRRPRRQHRAGLPQRPAPAHRPSGREVTFDQIDFNDVTDVN